MLLPALYLEAQATPGLRREDSALFQQKPVSFLFHLHPDDIESEITGNLYGFQF